MIKRIVPKQEDLIIDLNKGKTGLGFTIAGGTDTGDDDGIVAVSYTHLTQPTILLV